MRQRRWWRRGPAVGAGLAVLGLAAVLTPGFGRPGPSPWFGGNGHLWFWQTPRHAWRMASVFESADRAEVYGSPLAPDQRIHLGTLTKAADPRRWAAVAGALRCGGSGPQDKGMWILQVFLYQGERLIGVMSMYPAAGEVALRAEGLEYGRVWAGPAFRQVFERFEEKARDPKSPWLRRRRADIDQTLRKRNAPRPPRPPS